MEVKICGLVRRGDAESAAALGADYLGVVLSAGFGRSIAPADARALLEGLGPTPVGVLVDEDADGAVRLGEAIGAGILQLHGHEPPALVSEIAARGPWRIWKSVRARVPEDLDRALDAYADLIDGILVEGFREGVVGGGGAVLDLEAFREARARIPSSLRVVLAGGLTPGTVGAALAHFAPDVVDVSSGVEKIPGRKDPELLRLFLERARAGAPQPSSSYPETPRETDRDH